MGVRVRPVYMSALKQPENKSDGRHKKSVDMLPASWVTYCSVTRTKTSESHQVDRVSEMKRTQDSERGEGER